MKSLALVLLVGLTACAGMNTKEKVAVACEGVASAGSALVEARQAGRITAAQLKDAQALYHTTDKFCEPVVSTISPMDFVELTSTTAELIKRAK